MTLQLLPQELVLRCAAATVGACEVGVNAGPYVERVLKLTGLDKGNPWCAAHVCGVGTAALGASWPVVKTASCVQLSEWARTQGVLTTTPEPGAIFLLHYEKLHRFAHTGFVVRKDGESWVTNEGNTSGSGSREGWLVAQRSRRFGPNDRFIHWWKVL